MGQYLETGIIIKISTKLKLDESLERGYIKSDYKNLFPEMFHEIKKDEKSSYEYYPKYINLKELEDTKLKFLKDYIQDSNEYKNQENEILEFFSNVKAKTSEELFEEIECYDKYGMVIDRDELYSGYTVYKLRLSLEGKMFLECYEEFIVFYEKILSERYENGYSKYLKVTLD